LHGLDEPTEGDRMDRENIHEGMLEGEGTGRLRRGSCRNGLPRRTSRPGTHDRSRADGPSVGGPAAASGGGTATSQVRLITGLSLWRSDAARPYAEPERQLMQAVFAHLIEARTQNRLLQLVQAANPRVTLPWRPAAADATGLLHHAWTCSSP
jgi:hypothetical protein